ncbi:PREDICTED: venom acid phosphatase Acph-1-like [Ceratosolen solmsi marchali]|uniref:acid phosphatase n=1 Tax=Ceratosolen solmsi marchali TaxID=326594 RepID=A0AAJ6YGL6_9HYME|nr:PREDICTED: venom acid phosphatase Acph-1-like [Ceratosolen solmsi marchali]
MLFIQHIICICVLFIHCGQCLFVNDLKLELVQVLFRHGQRTAQKNEVDLLINAKRSLYEFWGYGQLTNVGKQQAYRLGDMLRHKYSDFLGDAYKPEDVYACSSEIDRTKVSLQLVLAALFPPMGKHVWNKNLKWMPIPIHFVPIELDILFNSLECSKFQELRKNLMNRAEIKNLIAKYKDIIDLLNEKNSNVNFDMEMIFYINNLLNIQRTLNISQPEWYTPVIARKLNDAAKLYLEINCYTPNMIRMNNGLTRRILENMDLNGTISNSYKIHLFSGHEFNIYAFAKGHSITLEEIPGYSSSFIVEKYRNNHDKVFVKIYMWTGQTEELKLIKLKKCKEYCPIDNYQILVNDFLPSNDEMHCMYKNLSITNLQRFL